MRNKWLVFAFAAVAWAQQAPDVRPGTVQGRVRNSVSGEPILRAHVTLIPLRQGGTLAPYGALSNADGSFSVSLVPPGQYLVRAERTGFLSGNPNQPAVIQLAPAETRHDANVDLIPLGAISGRVVDAEGEPVEGVSVGATAGSTMVSSAITDEQGRFRIALLAPARYRLCATPLQFPGAPEIRTDGSRETHYSPTCYPGVLAGQANYAVDVAAGVEVNALEVRLIETPWVRVRGKVTGLLPGYRCTVVLGMPPNASGGAAVAKPDGSFEIWGAAPGKYMARANAMPTDPSPPQLASGPVAVDVGSGNIDGLFLSLLPPFEVPGQIVFEDEEARPPKRVGPQSATPQISLSQGTQYIRPVEIAEDGTFTLHNVRADKYTVGVSWPNTYVKSVSLGTSHVEGASLDLSSGAAASLSVVVSSGLAEISGKVEGDSSALVDRIVILIPQDPNGSPKLAALAVLASGGSYSVKTAPGKYWIRVGNDSDRAYLQRDFRLESFREGAVAIDLQPRDKVIQDLKLP